MQLKELPFAGQLRPESQEVGSVRLGRTPRGRTLSGRPPRGSWPPTEQHKLHGVPSATTGAMSAP
jgi:hypothetical protein